MFDFVFSPSAVILYGLVGLAVLLALFSLVRVEIRFKRMFASKKGTPSLDELLSEIQNKLANVQRFQLNMDKKLENIDGRLAKSVRGVGIVRFNPFQGSSGSNQSFSLALLDENGSGVVLSTLYSRERVSTFAKPLKEYTCEYDLTNEEKEAISRARAYSHNI